MTRLRLWPVAVWIAGIVICAAIIAHTHFTTDLSAFLPRNPSPAERALIDQLRDGPVSRVILVGIEGAPESTLNALSSDLANRLRKEPAFAAVNNGEDVNLERDQNFLWNHRYLLSPISPERFTEAGLRQALDSDLDLLNSDAGLFVKSALPRDPTGEMLRILDTVQAGAPGTTGEPWLSSDRKRAVLILQTSAPASDVDAQQAALADVGKGFDAARMDAPNAAAARIITSGPVVFSVKTRDRIKGDAERFSLIATILVAGILFGVYRSARQLFFGLLPVLSGAAAGIAAVSLVFGTVHGITLGFGVTLIGESVDYPVYLLTQTDPGSRLRDTLVRIWPTLRAGVMTSICGFGALLFSSFDGLAQLGVFTIAGLAAAVSVTRWVLPSLMPEPVFTRRAGIIGDAMHRLLSIAPRLRWPAFALIGAAAVVLALRANAIWDDRLESLSPIPAAEQRLDQTLRSEAGAPDVRYLVVTDATNDEAALETAERVDTALDALVASHALSGFQSPAFFLPSRATQLRRQAAIPEPGELKARLEQALQMQPFRLESFTPFLNEIAAAKHQPVIDRQALAGTSFAQLVDALLVRHNGYTTVLTPLRDISDPARVASAIAALGIPGVKFLDLKRDADSMYAAYRYQAMTFALLGVLAIAIFLALVLRRLSRVAAVLWPLAAAIVVTAGAYILAGQLLSLFNLVGLLLVVAVGSNYSLFFERERAEGEKYERIIASLAIANVCTAIGFGVLSLSAVPVLHAIGATVAIGAVLSLVFSAVYARRADAVAAA